MYSDAESDDDYAPYDSYRLRGRGQLHLRILDDLVYEAKDKVYFSLTDPQRHLEVDDDQPWSSKKHMRALAARPDFSWYNDWRRIRFQRVFRELEGFYTGSLDLSGRSVERYARLASRFVSFAEDAKSLAPHVMYITEERLKWHSEQSKLQRLPVSVPVVPPELSPFCDRWKITSHLSYETMLDCLLEMSSIITEHSTPKFQELHLVDLPPEILTIAFDHLSVEDARSLSSTCKYLRAVGVKQIFSTRFIAMSPPNDSELHELIPSSDAGEVTAQVHALMTKSREYCIREVQFLATRPDICACLRTLTLGNSWRESVYDGTLLGNAIMRPSDPFFGTLLERFTDLLHHVQLETLAIQYLALDETFVSELVRHPPSLPELYQCRASTDLQVALAAGTLRATVQGLSLHFIPPRANDAAEDDDFEQYTSWALLGACPQLRLLHVYNAIPRQSLPLPDPRFWSSFAGLNTVERVHLDGISPDISDFIALFAHAALRGPLCVTHLKLKSAWSIPEDDILVLLRVLHAGGSPLTVLALDGIYPLTTVLFDGLVRLFPNLVALTVIRRDGFRQHQAKFCTWDRPVYEYAACLRPLTRLRHFAANFRHDLRTPLSPFAMRHLETNFAYQNTWDVPDSADYMSDTTQSMVLPFAASCPSLESFHLTASCSMYEYNIRRLPGGGFELKENSHFGGITDNPEWNPIHAGSTFPLPRP
ncbi:hypothetical protein EXIGLDRAFT_845269 [Exidia glandulosa HHB12029]|uniref:F-box domain-containing protein n=1 Tax=Exidia glandulosa HHB12029 TaxID=1314781 RepID=A0A165BJW6_EXIGL|nr:hypothetical protein EXIGLDRAFT_845269 [Exidia glandulosa HHB12029]